jgi:hypothetical protein
MAHILLKDLINENRMELLDFYKAVRERCPVSVEGYFNKHGAYRGSRAQNGYERYDPTNRFRKSKDSNNFSLLITDTMDSWKNIPSRSKSLIFTCYRGNAADYGTVNAVFIEGDPVVGWGTRMDNYDNYRAGFIRSGVGEHITSIESFDTTLSRMFSTLSKFFNVSYSDCYLTAVSDAQDLLKTVESFDKMIQSNDVEGAYQLFDEGHDSRRHKFLLKLFKEKGLMNVINTVYDAEINEIKSAPLSEFLKLETSSEAWTSAPYYMVAEHDVFKAYLKGEPKDDEF